MRSGSPSSILPAVKSREQNILKTAQLQQAMSGGLLGRSRRSPIRGRNSSVSRHGLLGIGSLKQLPKPACQQFDGLPQGAEFRNPDHRDGQVQGQRWGTQYVHGLGRMMPGDKQTRGHADRRDE